jgi:hypothetical protein
MADALIWTSTYTMFKSLYIYLNQHQTHPRPPSVHARRTPAPRPRTKTRSLVSIFSPDRTKTTCPWSTWSPHQARPERLPLITTRVRAWSAEQDPLDCITRAPSSPLLTLAPDVTPFHRPSVSKLTLVGQRLPGRFAIGHSHHPRTLPRL